MLQVVHLLLDLVRTSIVSATLSIPIILSHLCQCFAPRSCDSPSLYLGTVWHERRRPIRHCFSYPVRYALFDLTLSSLPGYLSLHECREAAATSGPVHLLTIPRSVGYEQNPLSLYYCYDNDGQALNLKKCIAEVTNTPWGEKSMFVFNPHSDIVAKPLHVSPFMDMMGDWNIKASAPGDTLSVTITVEHPKQGSYFSAALKASKVSSSNAAQFFWLMPQKVALWIYWHAIVLLWKGVEFIPHPRDTSPSYREDAVARDRILRCSRLDGSSPSREPRWIKWIDAKWPWS